MDKPPKRRVLSLSLSQPGKQHKKLKSKRHASSTSEIDKSLDPDESQQVSIARDHFSTDIPQSCPVVSPTSNLKSPPHCNEIELSKLSSRPLRKVKGQVSEFLEDEGHLKTIKCESASSGSRQDSTHCLSKVPSTDTKALSKDKLTKKAPVKDELQISENVKIPVDKMVLSKRKKANTCSDTESTLSGNVKTIPATALEGKSNVADSSSPARDVPLSSVDVTSFSDVKIVPDISPNANYESNEVLQCPLCYRNFDKLPTKTSHLKGCALKHKLSTQQLLDALELQQRQAAERRALGLPEIRPPVGNIKKSVTSKKENRTNSKMDSNMQLAMALSLSLQDQEKALGDLRKTEVANAVSLDHFGFTSKSVLDAVKPRPPSPLPRGKTKASGKKVPPLLTRTAEERQRIITEKVAMVLLEEAVSGENESLQERDLQSAYLQECLDKEKLLWVKSHTSPSKNDRASYYVKGLRGFISPSKVEMGSKVMHLSQIVGRVKTPTKEKEQMQKKSVEVELTSPSDEGSSSDSNSNKEGESNNPSHLEMELRAKLFNDWAAMVNNSTMSDLTIYPQEGREIRTHKIILHVRCPRILRDISRQRNPLTGNEVEVVMWSRTPHAAALAFLEFIYCGSVKSIRVLSEDLSSMIWLANHYKITDLLRYMRALTESETCETPSQAVINFVRDVNKQSSESHDIQEESVNCEAPQKNVIAHDGISTPILKEGKSAHSRKLYRASVDPVPSPALTPSRSETESIYSEMTLPGAENRSSCSSPDMFADDDVPPSPEEFLEEDRPHSFNKHFSSINIVRNDVENGGRPPSQCASISSEKTVVVEKNSPTQSHCASISSQKTDIIEKSPEPPPSPTLSNASAETQVLDCNQDVSKQTSFSLNDSKRKLSDGSEDGDTSACKRACPMTSSPGRPSENKSSDVECLDLTQDSDSNASLPVVSNNLSEESCDKILISSENEMSDSDAKSEQTILNSQSSRKEDSEVAASSKCRQSDDLKRSLDLSNDSAAEPNRSPSVKSTEPYVSPVWDGFEDIHYENPFPFPDSPVNVGPPPVDSLSPETVAVSSTSSPDGISQFVEKNLSQKIRISVSSKEDCEVTQTNCEGSNSPSDCEMTYQSPKTLAKESQPSTSSGFGALLDESLNVSDTFLQQAESGLRNRPTQRETKGTPVNRILATEQDGVTPLMNYSAMKTPELRRELQKFGLKPTLGKRKGKIMLRHIYNELHPWVPADSEANLQDKIFLSQPSSSNIEKQTFSCSQPNSRKLRFTDCNAGESNAKDSRSTESDSDSDDSRSFLNSSRQEIQYLEEECDDVGTLQASQPVTSKNELPKVVSKFIRNDQELHQKVLEYEPIWIEKLQTDLRDKGFKFKMADLMAFLDEKCITFRTSQGGPRVKKRNQKSANSKKKTVATSSDTNDVSD